MKPILRHALLLLFLCSCASREQWQYASLYYEAGSTEKKIEWLEQFRAAYPDKIRTRVRFDNGGRGGWHDEAWLHFKLAGLYTKAKDYGAAERNLLAAQACLDNGAEQDDPDTSRHAGDYYFYEQMIALAKKQGDQQKRLAYAEAGIEKWSQHPNAHHNMQVEKYRALQDMGRATDAERQYAVLERTDAAADEYDEMMAPAREAERQARHERMRAEEEADERQRARAMGRMNEEPDRGGFALALVGGLQTAERVLLEQEARNSADQLERARQRRAAAERSRQEDLAAQRRQEEERRSRQAQLQAQSSAASVAQESRQTTSRATGQASARDKPQQLGPTALTFSAGGSQVGSFPKGVTTITGPRPFHRTTIGSLSVKYDFGIFFGEPTAACVMKWTRSGEGKEDLPSVRIRLALSTAAGDVLYYSASPNSRKSGKGYGFDIAGSPSWDAFLQSSGGDFVSEERAKSFLKKATTVRVVEIETH